MYEKALLQRLALAHRSACTWTDPRRVIGKVLERSHDAEPTGRRRLVGKTTMFEFWNGVGERRFPHSTWIGVTERREWTVSAFAARDCQSDRKDNLWVTISADTHEHGKGFWNSTTVGQWRLPVHRRAFDGSDIAELPLLDLLLARDAFIDIGMRALQKGGRLDPEISKELSNGFDGFDNFPIEEFTLGERRWTGVERVAGPVELRQAEAIGDRARDGELEAWLGYGEHCSAFYTVVVRRDFVCATRTSDFLVDPYHRFWPDGPEVFRQPCPVTGDTEIDAELRNDLRDQAFEAVGEHGRTMGVETRKRAWFEVLPVD